MCLVGSDITLPWRVRLFILKQVLLTFVICSNSLTKVYCMLIALVRLIIMLYLQAMSVVREKSAAKCCH